MIDGRPFALDRFQTEAIAALDEGHSVLVAAPTGAGKTVVAEEAIDRALAAGAKAFYTTPIKALSNQKFRDLQVRYGPDAVGLLTGDNAVHPHAPVVVMTTEVLRNMLYAGSEQLAGLRYVILDEVHYLEDSYRGQVWEEVIINLDPSVGLVALSATVSNADELAGWLGTIRGTTATVVQTERPVELVDLYLVGDRTSPRLHLIPTLVDGRPNREGGRFDPAHKRGAGRGRGRRAPYTTPRRVEVIGQLADEDMLPAIYFIFSRAACDDAARVCQQAGLALTDRDERGRIRAIVEDRLRHLPAADLAALGYSGWAAGLESGVAAHHAGMVPAFKETVELCFQEGLIKAVFATETLALGINMPARSVVLEKVSKFNGDHHEFLTPGQYTQMAGRAGRRGIDPIGYAAVLWSPFVPFDQVASLAGSRSFELTSAFRPTYNMVANLVSRCDRQQARDLVASSFAQYQADRQVTRLLSRLQRRQQRAAELARVLGEQRGAVADYRDFLRAGGDAAADDEITEAVTALAPGDVVTNIDGRRRLLVLSVAQRKGGRVRVRTLDVDGTPGSLELDDFVRPPIVADNVVLPQPFAPNRRSFQKEAAALLRRADAERGDDRRRNERSGLDDRVTVLERLERVEAEVRELQSRIDRRSGSLIRRLDAVIEVLTDWGHLDGWELTERGRDLLRIYHERDLLIAESLHQGIFDDLDAAEVAALASCLCYENRSPGPPPAPWFPSRRLRDRFEALDAVTRKLNTSEAAHRLPVTRPPDPGFVALAHAWALGAGLDDVLDEDELRGGDFVRVVKQTIDLLRQLASQGPDPATRRIAGEAADRLHRGVVALAGAVDEGRRA